VTTGAPTRRHLALLGAPAVLVTLSLGSCGSHTSGTKTHPSARAGTIVAAQTRSAGSLGTASGGPVAPRGEGWSTLLNSSSHFGAAAADGPLTAHLRWQRRLEGPIVAGPVTRGSVAYVTSTRGALHAIDITSGHDLWTFDGGRGATPPDLSTSPTLLANGLILWPAPDNRVIALSPSGRVRWIISGAGEPLTPAVDEAGHLLVIADTMGHLSGYRLRPDNAAPLRLWTHTLGTESFGNPTLGSDGTTYETAGDGLSAFAADGQLRWRLKISQTIETSAAVAEDGTIVFGGNDEIEYGIGPEGSVRWRHPIGNYTYSSPLALPDDRVIYGNHSGEMTILDARDGHEVSIDRGAGQLWTAAAVDRHGDVYFASRAGTIYGFDAAGRRLFTIQAGGTFDSYPAIAADGTLLVGGDDGVLRAIG